MDSICSGRMCAAWPPPLHQHCSMSHPVTSIARPIAMPIAIAAIAAIASAIAITDQRHHCYQYQPHTASRVPTTAATTCLECPLLASTIAHSHNNAMLLPQCLRIVTATVTRRCPRQPGVAYQVEWPTQRLPRTHAHTHARTPARPSANGTGSDFEALSRSQVLAAAVPRHGKARGTNLSIGAYWASAQGRTCVRGPTCARIRIRIRIRTHMHMEQALSLMEDNASDSVGQGSPGQTPGTLANSLCWKSQYTLHLAWGSDPGLRGSGLPHPHCALGHTHLAPGAAHTLHVSRAIGAQPIGEAVPIALTCRAVSVCRVIGQSARACEG